jgi:hypothetical protein
MNYLLGVVDKMDEASFFSRRMRDDPDQTHHYMNAFAGATFAVWECLAKLCRPNGTRSEPCEACGNSRDVYPDDDAAWEWFKQTKKATTKSPIGKYFHDGRSADVHAGAGFVDGYSITIWADRDGEIQSNNTPLLKDAGVLGLPDGRPPADACEDYLASLVRILVAAYGKFAETWDQAGDLKSDIARLQGTWAGNVQ